MTNGQLEAFSTILILEDISIISLEKTFYLQKILITRKTLKKEKLTMRIQSKMTLMIQVIEDLDQLPEVNLQRLGKYWFNFYSKTFQLTVFMISIQLWETLKFKDLMKIIWMIVFLRQLQLFLERQVQHSSFTRELFQTGK